jgi:peptide deformylase
MWKPKKAPLRVDKKKIFQEVIKTCDFIYQIGEYGPLRKPSLSVALSVLNTNAWKAKLKYLKSCFAKYKKLTGKGRGLAAVQVGIGERFILVYLKKEKKSWILINPKIVGKSEVLLRYPEICMSANPLVAPVVRPSYVKVEYYDEKGNKRVWEEKDTTLENRMLNRVLQHEIDHLDGILCIDRVESREIELESKLKAYAKKRFEKVSKRA